MANVLKTCALTLFVSLATQGAFAAQDDDFVEEASAKGVAEVEAGKLAQEKGNATDVKSFAEMMVQDHTAANAKLKSIADAKNLNVSDSAELMDKAKAAILELRSAKSFDQAYANNQVKAHEGKRMANTPTELQYLGRWCPRILSGRDHPYRQDFHAPTQLLPQTI